MSRQAAVLVALVAIAVAALLISVGSLILMRRSVSDGNGSGPSGAST
jgi:hypothetical protein